MRILRNTLLNITAFGGLICLTAVAAAVLLDLSLIMFKTDSMAPAIPAGAVALVREIPASDLMVGDVVTVERPGRLPVTHRIQDISIPPGGSPSKRSDDDMRILTLKGDANSRPDPTPYSVTHVRKVLGSAPGLAQFIVAAGRPQVMLSLTVAAALLITWVLWPRNESAEVVR